MTIKAIVGVSLNTKEPEVIEKISEDISSIGLKMIETSEFFMIGVMVDLKDIGMKVTMLDARALFDALDLVETKLSSPEAEFGICLFEVDENGQQYKGVKYGTNSSG